MLVSYKQFNHMPVMSLQTGSELARTIKPIIDPRSLNIVAYELDGKLLSHKPTLLLIGDIREIGPLGIIIDSTDELVNPKDVIKVNTVYEFGFELEGIRVVDDRKRSIGTVSDYSIDTTGFTVQQIAVKQPIFKRISEPELLIHRSQIIKVTDDDIVVKSPSINNESTSRSQNFVNPFRESARPSQTETIDS